MLLEGLRLFVNYFAYLLITLCVYNYMYPFSGNKYSILIYSQLRNCEEFLIPTCMYFNEQFPLL